MCAHCMNRILHFLVIILWKTKKIEEMNPPLSVTRRPAKGLNHGAFSISPSCPVRSRGYYPQAATYIPIISHGRECEVQLATLATCVTLATFQVLHSRGRVVATTLDSTG